MTKDEIIKTLNDHKISHDPLSNKADLEKLLPGATQAEVTRYCRRPLCEGGEQYDAGEKITLTADRAAALGDLVTEHEPE